MTKYFYFFYSAVVDFQVALVVKNFPVAQRVKNLLAMQETRVRSLGWEDPLEEGMQPTPVFLPGESPCTEEHGGVAKSQIQLSD